MSPSYSGGVRLLLHVLVLPSDGRWWKWPKCFPFFNWVKWHFNSWNTIPIELPLLGFTAAANANKIQVIGMFYCICTFTFNLWLSRVALYKLLLLPSVYSLPHTLVWLMVIVPSAWPESFSWWKVTLTRAVTNLTKESVTQGRHEGFSSIFISWWYMVHPKIGLEWLLNITLAIKGNAFCLHISVRISVHTMYIIKYKICWVF